MKPDTLTVYELGITDDGDPCVVLVGPPGAVKAVAHLFGQEVVVKPANEGEE